MALSGAAAKALGVNHTEIKTTLEGFAAEIAKIQDTQCQTTPNGQHQQSGDHQNSGQDQGQGQGGSWNNNQGSNRGNNNYSGNNYSCNDDKKCFYCKGDHFIAVCEKKFEDIDTDKIMIENNYMKLANGHAIPDGSSWKSKKQRVDDYYSDPANKAIRPVLQAYGTVQNGFNLEGLYDCRDDEIRSMRVKATLQIQQVQPSVTKSIIANPAGQTMTLAPESINALPAGMDIAQLGESNRQDFESSFAMTCKEKDDEDREGSDNDEDDTQEEEEVPTSRNKQKKSAKVTFDDDFPGDEAAPPSMQKMVEELLRDTRAKVVRNKDPIPIIRAKVYRLIGAHSQGWDRGGS
ncbi:hypothetical protein B0H14DRAFT_2603774 [Mycena olivaceomarginata]|nr:hypothetical protein B0H14DRAFT_2603774 [Mycena olivaceomarginata]